MTSENEAMKKEINNACISTDGFDGVDILYDSAVSDVSRILDQYPEMRSIDREGIISIMNDSYRYFDESLRYSYGFIHFLEKLCGEDVIKNKWDVYKRTVKAVAIG